MKREQQIPKNILNRIQSEHDRAMAAMLKGKTRYAAVPTRMVNMTIDRPSIGPVVEKVIIPPIDVYADKDSFFDNNTLLSGRLDFFLPLLGKPYPIAHVFSSSGRICFGNIPVPSQIPANSPWAPIDTLLLYNDHHTAHGSASHIVSATTILQVMTYLQNRNINISEDARMTFVEGVNLIANDAIWILSADIVKQQQDTLASIQTMNVLFDIIFK